MAILNFPRNPGVGDNYEANGVTYEWTGTHWESLGTANFVKIPGDTMTGNLNLPSVNEYIFMTAADKPSAKEGDAVVYKASTGALVLRSRPEQNEIVQIGGSTGDAGLVNPLNPNNPGSVACTTPQPSGTGYTEMMVVCHGVFEPGDQNAEYLIGHWTYEIQPNGSQKIFKSDYVKWYGKRSEGQETFSAQGFYDINPQRKYISKIGISKNGPTGTASPIKNCSIRVVFTK